MFARGTLVLATLIIMLVFLITCGRSIVLWMIRVAYQKWKVEILFKNK